MDKCANANWMYVLAKLFLCIFLLLLWGKDFFIKYEFGQQIVAYFDQEAYAFIWSKEFSNTDSMLVEKKCRPIFSLKLEVKLYERKLCGFGTTQTELDLNLSSVSS